MSNLGFGREDITDLSNSVDKLITVVRCKSIHIGWLRFEPEQPVTFTSKGIRLIVPVVGEPNKNVELHIMKSEVVKILGFFSPSSESMVAFYILRVCAQYIKHSLQVPDDDSANDGVCYFAPNNRFQTRRIILQIDNITTQARSVIRSIWEFFDDISASDAKEFINRAATKEQTNKKKHDEGEIATSTKLRVGDTRQLLIYPSDKGGVSISTKDCMCLAKDQYLNDIIIDFYLKWVHLNIVPEKERESVFIFSTFFYKRLTTFTRPLHDKGKVEQTAAQMRHARVQKWTKDVNLFEKDYIVIPINKQSHWFLAIICFPKLSGPVTYDTNEPVEPQLLKKQKGSKKLLLPIGNTTIMPHADETPGVILCEDDNECDEAAGDESDLAFGDSELDFATAGEFTAVPSVNSTPTTPYTPDHEQNIKQPLILIFDSLAGVSRSGVVATLRDYLTCEYSSKMPSNAPPRVFNKDNMPGHCVQVPQQNNTTDCGLFVLQYVEQFFIDAIKDFKLPIKLNNWFDILTVTRKREEISHLLQQLMDKNNLPQTRIILPEIPFPTLNGVFVEPADGGYSVDYENAEEMTNKKKKKKRKREALAEEDVAIDVDIEMEEIKPTPIKSTSTISTVELSHAE